MAKVNEQHVHLDAQLIRRYGGEGPRYTSYPTAMQFHEALAPDAYEVAVCNSAGAGSNQPLSAYVHIPFCISPCLYCACNMRCILAGARLRTFRSRAFSR